MKFNQLLLPALTLLAGAVANGVSDCAWDKEILYTQDVEDPTLILKSKCPPPQNDGDVYTVGELDLNQCVVTNSDGQIAAQKDGGAFYSVDANACSVDDTTLNCGRWGSLVISDIVKVQGQSFECSGYTAETKTKTQGVSATPTPTP